MISAYSDYYLSDARRCLANSFDYAVYTLGFDLQSYYEMFIRSDIRPRFESGDPFIVSGKSGVEVALMVTEKVFGTDLYKERVYYDGKSPEYWVGWALAFYQWYTACDLTRLNEEVPITTILAMYEKYHEMDICHFVERMNELRQKSRVMTYVKKIRMLRGYSQSELATLTGIPIKTLQHYEQGDKSIRKANADYLIALSRVLECDPRELLE